MISLILFYEFVTNFLFIENWIVHLLVLLCGLSVLLFPWISIMLSIFFYYIVSLFWDTEFSEKRLLQVKKRVLYLKLVKQLLHYMHWSGIQQSLSPILFTVRTTAVVVSFYSFLMYCSRYSKHGGKVKSLWHSGGWTAHLCFVDQS
jgi:hypothetical protein